MAEALLAPDLAYHLLLAGLCRRTESQEKRCAGETGKE
jgi:hypothetical protein